ncbi:hypothetical protein HK405_007847 [Cladochytrium tenue]|nr:hypothetical protein HK405_007847 [Cladochytrium tenue]
MLRPVFEVFLSQLRGLLGVKPLEVVAADKLLPGFSVTYEQGPYGISGWELDRLVRVTVAQNVADSVRTMLALSTLIDSMENMVVLDHISDELTEALDSLDAVVSALSSAGPADLVGIAAQARRSVVAAESAFFDPTMVAMLYFPDEHRLAVFMPLFTPVLGSRQ